MLSPAQIIGFDEIDPDKVSPWRVDIAENYAGAYHFGESEGESSLLLMNDGVDWVAQLRTYEWSDEGQWITIYRVFENITIKGNSFNAADISGEFVEVVHDGETLKGLKINQPWSPGLEEGKYEVGIFSRSIEPFFYGRYPFCSTRHLTREELTSLSSDQLQIMRNEIFARYGYRFIKGGAMDRYFRQQDWYQPQHQDVNDFLTLFERNNITLIREVEGKK